MSDNKSFWKTVKPFFFNKGIHRGNIELIEGNQWLQVDSEVAEALDDFFKEAVSTSNVNKNFCVINPNTIKLVLISRFFPNHPEAY